MTPSKEELETKARHFANTVFLIGAGVIMLAASLSQPLLLKWLGQGMGEHAPFIGASALILLLALKRPQLALFSLERACLKYGHVLREGSLICTRCLRNVPPEQR